MDLRKEKIKLLRRRRLSRLASSSLYPEKKDWLYLLKFLQKKKKLFIAIISFLLLQGLFEVVLVIISHRYLRSGSSSSLVFNNSFLLIIILIAAAIYLASSYLAVKSERTFIIRLINDLRERWFKLFLYKRESEHSLESKSMLIAKVSYHLPLLGTGLNNSLAGALRFLLFVFILFFLSFLFGYKLVILSLAAIAVSVLLAYLAYYISYNYVSRETTFYSHIIRTLDFNLSDWKFVKKFSQEKSVLREFNELVELDTYFRVRRDLWLRFSVSIVFVLLIIFSFVAAIWGGRIEYFFSRASLDSRFLMIIALFYFSRLLYESVRLGLYSVPLLLGLKLSVPKFSARPLKAQRSYGDQPITFKSTKSRLFKKGKYKSFLFSFEPGGRYLIKGDNRSGRSSLARVFSGLARYGRRTWLIISNKKRYFYNEFFDKYNNFYYLDPNFKSERSLLEVAVGKGKNRLDDSDLAQVSALINEHRELKDIFFEKEDWRFRADHFCVNLKNICLIQIINCLLTKPYLVAVDNIFLERKDPEIDKLLQLLDKLLPKTILVFFSRENDQLINYNNEYEI